MDVELLIVGLLIVAPLDFSTSFADKQCLSTKMQGDTLFVANWMVMPHFPDAEMDKLF